MREKRYQAVSVISGDLKKLGKRETNGSAISGDYEEV
jgi:hypothetical protein